ncbi:uncharacterized protein G2W53_010658 [Senna tora]|uniref:Uncharacterized protein n=1 Tax=Senna tora TaxID=362788 RepID=A0A835C9Z6_9FABA|nr:uncharacterized protein G2W53_010658 [Senna tora]
MADEGNLQNFQNVQFGAKTHDFFSPSLLPAPKPTPLSLSKFPNRGGRARSSIERHQRFLFIWINEQGVVRDGRLKAKFCLDRDIDKHFVIKKLGKNWRNYRVFLFGRYQMQIVRNLHRQDNDPKRAKILVHTRD